MKKKRIMIISVLSLLLVVAVMINSSASYYCTFDHFPTTRQGDSNGYVRALQTIIKYNLNSALANDGIFGSDTKSAVQGYQSHYGLSADGIVGYNTWHSMYNRLDGRFTGSTDGGAYEYTFKIKRQNGTSTNTDFFTCWSGDFGMTGTWRVYKAAPGSEPGQWYLVGRG